MENRGEGIRRLFNHQHANCLAQLMGGFIRVSDLYFFKTQLIKFLWMIRLASNENPHFFCYGFRVSENFVLLKYKTKKDNPRRAHSPKRQKIGSQFLELTAIATRKWVGWIFSIVETGSLGCLGFRNPGICSEQSKKNRVRLIPKTKKTKTNEWQNKNPSMNEAWRCISYWKWEFSSSSC